MLRELQWRQQHLIQREKLASLGTLLFGVVHELNNPLSNISTSCQILKEELLEADLQFKQTLLKQIEDETDRARDIVRSILDFSRAGHRQEAALAHIVAESIRLLKAELPPKVELQVEVPPDIVLFVDKQKLRQVFLNLLKNAAEAMPQGGKVLVQAERKGAQVLIRVSDTGAGMEPEVAEKVFDPFFTTKDRKKGYGLGLFVVHNIIQEHGGDISVESSPGRGTTFTISLEAKEDAPRQDTHS
jgi:signal transduction histidine kinase